MEVRRLGPVVGLGTWNTFGGDVEPARRVVTAALDAGVELFDTSPMYRSEQALGRALAGRGRVATKIWASTVEEGQEQLERQLDWFGGRVEIEQVHNLRSWREHLPWLEEARAAGRVDKLGVTHYDDAAFDELAEALRTGRFDVLQVPYNPWERSCEAVLLPLAAELGVAVIAMRPLGGSGEGVRRRVEPSPSELAELEVESWTEALLRWALSDERIDVVIPATSKPERAAANARAGAGPALTPEQRTLVERLAQ